MDTQQEEMQFLGLFGIFAESFKLIFRWRKIFSQITLALILPLSFLFLTHDQISAIPNHWIKHAKYNKLADLVSSVWAAYILFKTFYFTFLIVFSLLSTSAVVYTVASIYASREITFQKVLGVVPKVWKRLMITFLSTFIGFFAYNIVYAIAILLWIEFIDEIAVVGPMFLWITFTSYPIGLIYMAVIWQLASVVTVLEDSCGLRAMIKSKNLIKGKILVASVIFFMLYFCLVVIETFFRRNVVYNWRNLGVALRSGMGVLCLLLLLILILFALVVHTVIYFVCKSYHRENIDKSALSDHLEVYLGDYVPLKAKDVQLEDYHV